MLRDRAHVQGDVTTNGTATLNEWAVVDGQVFENESVATDTRRFTIDFGDGSGGSISSEPGQVTTLAPGSYQSISIKGTLTLTAGRYFFLGGFTLEPQGRLNLYTEAGPVLIFAGGKITLRGPSTGLNVAQPALLLATTSTDGIQLETSYTGVLLAPNGKINISTGGPFVGQAFGKDIELHQERVWQNRSSAFLGRLFEALPSPGLQIAGTEQLADVLPNNDIGTAILAVVAAGYASTSQQQLASAVATLRSLPATDVVAALSRALDAAPDLNTRWAMVSTARHLRRPEAAPFFAELLQQPVPTLSQAHGHDFRLAAHSRISVPGC